MKSRILAGMLAALMYGTLAGAQEEEPREEGLDIGVAEDFGPESQPPPADEDVIIPPDILAPPEEEGIGGAGEAGVEEQPGLLDEEPGIPPDSEDTGGAGWEEEEGTGGAGISIEPRGKRENADMRGVTLLIGGGIEGYTGALAPEVDPGAVAGVSATFRPSRVFGFELGYSGAINEVDERLVGLEDNGADLVRNGGHAALTLGLTATPLQPYVLGGVGVSFYNIRNGTAAGFEDDTVGNVPVGLGLRTHLGGFTADARIHYNFLLGQQFAPGTEDTGGSYAGTVNLGGTF